MIAGTRARLIGTMTVNVVPVPSADRTTIEPLSARIARRTTSMPTPRPDTVLTRLAVLNPGRKIISCASSRLISRSPGHGGGLDLPDGDATPVIDDVDDHGRAAPEGAQDELPAAGLPSTLAFLRRLDPMIDGVD